MLCITPHTLLVKGHPKNQQQFKRGAKLPFRKRHLYYRQSGHELGLVDPALRMVPNNGISLERQVLVFGPHARLVPRAEGGVGLFEGHNALSIVAAQLCHVRVRDVGGHSPPKNTSRGSGAT